MSQAFHENKLAMLELAHGQALGLQEPGLQQLDQPLPRKCVSEQLDFVQKVAAMLQICPSC